MTKESTNNIASIVLAGGKGTRLFPLTLHHSKPAVPYAGRYRLIDIPISNSINSDIKNIYVIAQYLTTELEFHLQTTYQFDSFSSGAIHFISPEEKANGERVWFEGTADAIRKCLPTLLKSPAEYFLILSGDQLYNIDFNKMFSFAKSRDANLTVAALKVSKQDVNRLGILKIDHNHFITDFIEKPQDPEQIKGFEIDDKGAYLGSMGIYIFKREALVSLLEKDKREDFGKHLIPTEMQQGKTAAFLYDGYWEDIGTISSFYEANLALTRKDLPFDIYDEEKPIFTRPCSLPGPLIEGTMIERSILSDGSHIYAKRITDSIIGMRSYIAKGSIIEQSLILGNHISYAGKEKKATFFSSIGQNCVIRRAIIDEEVTIGNNVQLINKRGVKQFDGERVFIRDGIIVVPAHTEIPDDFVL